MQPADTIISELGGPAAVARIVGVHRTRVSNWKRPRSKGGSGGIIPQRHVPALLAAAQAKGLKWTADFFLPPRPEADAA